MVKQKYTRVCISDSAHSLMFYLMMSSPEEIDSTFFFLSDGIHPSNRAKLPSHAYIPIVRFRRNAWCKGLFLLYLIVLRLTARLRWPFLKTAKIFAMDHLFFSAPLIGGRDYTLLADGPNCFFNIRTTPDYQNFSAPANQRLSVKLVRLLLGPCWHKCYGMNGQCTGVVKTTPDSLEAHEGKENRLFSLSDLWNGASDAKKKQILAVYDITEEDEADMRRRPVILLTQQLATEGTVTEEELAKIYSDLLKPFPPDSILIKRHPRDRMDYRKYFPQALVYDKFAPMQLFAAIGIRFQTAVTLFSSSVTSFPEAQVIWGGTEVHPAVFRRYGKQQLPETK